MPTLLLSLNQLSKMLKIWRKFINLPNVYSVVQNNNLKLQISTMVNSVHRLWYFDIGFHSHAVVVLYNLTNINVSERYPTNFQPLGSWFLQ